MGIKQKNLVVREESFGGIVFLKKRGITFFLNKEAMSWFGVKNSELWNEESNFYYTAPLEVHFSFTSYCPFECTGCYADSGKKVGHVLGNDDIFRILNILSDMKVFQIAFGGGEPFSHPHFFEFVKYTLAKGILPNVTTNGYYTDDDIAKKCKVFGSINVSIDGIGREKYLQNRGSDGWDYAHQAVRVLKKHGCNVGLNVVISRNNLSQLDDIFYYAREMGVKNILLLRFKPKGRGAVKYEEKRFNEEDLKSFGYRLATLNKYKRGIWLDCSFFPLVAYHLPDEKVLGFFSTPGCDGGNSLVSIDYEGKALPCSFFAEGEDVFQLKDVFKKSPIYDKFRRWEMNAKSPCNMCKYLNLCKGGCHLLSLYELNDFYAPDPTCPIVIDYRKGVMHASLKR